MIVPRELVRFARESAGNTLHTLGTARPFRVDVISDRIVYTPTSSDQPRMQSPNALQALCDRYNETQSLRNSDYRSVTAHAAYALALIDAYLRKDRASDRSPVRHREPPNRIASAPKAKETSRPKGEGSHKAASRAELLRILKQLQAAAEKSPDLLKNEYCDADRSVNLDGYCYILVEAMKRLFPDDFTVYRAGWDDGRSHWFLKDTAGEIFETIDRAAKPCMPARDYAEGRKRGLITPKISQRAAELLKRAGLQVASDQNRRTER